MINAEDKAKDLFVKIIESIPDFIEKGVAEHIAKQCAIIAVDEILSQWEYIDTYLSDLGGELNINLKYWLEVKQEIEKL